MEEYFEPIDKARGDCPPFCTGECEQEMDCPHRFESPAPRWVKYGAVVLAIIGAAVSIFWASRT